MIETTCEVCQQPMQAQRSSKKVCSATCRSARSRGQTATLSTGAGNHMATVRPNALTRQNVKQPKALTRQNENANFSPYAGKLIKHIEKFYTRDQLIYDLDCVLSCCRTEADWDAVLAAGRAQAERLKIHVRLRVPAKKDFTTFTLPGARATTAWNVAMGLQGRCDLERLN